MDLERPGHTLLLGNEILIVEYIMGLDALIGKGFRFFAVLKVQGSSSDASSGLRRTDLSKAI